METETQSPLKKQKIEHFFKIVSHKTSSLPPSEVNSQQLTPEELNRIEENRQKALELRRKKENEVLSLPLPLQSSLPAKSSSLLDYLTDEKWKMILAEEFKKEYFKQILSFLENEKKNKNIFPPENEIFSAFNFTSFDNIKVVIIGQDPYHDVGQAHGLCFSVKKGIKPPPSLKNIYKELSNDIQEFEKPVHGNLEKWAREGVFLLNSTLTVEAHKANSHANCGWQKFTDAVIRIINEKKKGVVFILWGGFARKKCSAINKTKHHVIEAAHPSPLSAKQFFGCKVFSKANAYLEKEGQNVIDWKLPKTI